MNAYHSTSSDQFDLQRGFTLGNCVVEPQRQHILREGETIHLEPRVMQVLVVLAQHSGTPVSRNKLLEAVWSDAVVGDEVLSRAISLLRQALGDERTAPVFIRTIPRQGYELIVPVSPLKTDFAGAKTSRMLAISAVLVFAVMLAAWWAWHSVESSDRDRLLVLMPIKADDQSLGGIAAGLSDDLYALVGAGTGLKSLAKRWSFGLRDTTLPPQGIAEQFDAQYLLEGTLERRNDALQLYLEIIELPDGSSLWWREFSAPDLPELRDRAVADAREALNSHLNAEIEVLPTRQHPTDEAAYKAYFQARHHWSLRGEEHIDRAADLLMQAIDLDPEFAAAYLALAQVYALQPFYSNVGVVPAFERARQQLERAVNIDSTLQLEADTLEGFMHMRTRSWQQAQNLLQQVIAADDSNALAHSWYAMLMSAMGRNDVAVSHARKAVELEPTSPVLRDRLGVNELWVNNLPAAGAAFTDAKRLGYNEAMHSKQYIVYLIRTAQFDELARGLRVWGVPGEWIEALAGVLAAGEVAPAFVERTEQEIAAGRFPQQLVFGAWVVLGQAERAIASFDFDYRSPDVELLWAAEGRVLHSAPGFEALLQRLGLLDHYRQNIQGES